MTNFDQLLTVQELDTRIDQLTYKRGALPERELLRQADTVLSTIADQQVEAEESLAAQTRELRRVEDSLGSSEAKAKDIDARLYGGTVSKAGELQDLQKELDAVRRRISAGEDDVLAAMDALEPLQARVAELAEQHKEIEEHRTHAEMTLIAAAADIDSELDECATARQKAIADIPTDLVADYERLRSGLKGVGVARLVRNRCEGCHLTLASAEVDRIRHLDDDEVVHCEECGRILVH